MTPFLTGRQSKLASLLELLIREQLPVELVLENGEAIYGTLTNYEFSPEQLILTVKGSSVYVVNFRHVLWVRVKRQLVL
ncbi:MAG: hypothetical protein QW734_05545 [Candidatus Bathyarchaeia archaeon]